MYALPAIYKKFLLHFSCQGKCQNLPVSHAYFFAQNHNTLLLFFFFMLHNPCLLFHLLSCEFAARHRNACSAQVSTYRYAVHTDKNTSLLPVVGSLLRYIPYQCTPAPTNCYRCPCKTKDKNRLPLVLLPPAVGIALKCFRFSDAFLQNVPCYLL
jgi:hypothetical protein